MIFVENKDLVIPGEVLADDDYYAGRGTFREDNKICSSLMGLVSLRNKKIRVIPLKSKYIPKRGDVVIGKIDDVRFSMWDVDINSPYSGILPAFEVLGREKKDLNNVFDVGDVLFLRVIDVDEVKKVKLGLKGKGMGKFNGGILVNISPTKVPRLIGKKGSMINMIKNKTNCKIVVGQNGLVWINGDPEMEQLTKKIINLIENEAHISGLTDRVKEKLYLAIDGEVPLDEDDLDEDGLEKPKLQDFRDELDDEDLEKPKLQDFRDELDDEDLEKPKLQDFKEDLEQIEVEKIDNSVENDVEDSKVNDGKTGDSNFYNVLKELKKRNKSRSISLDSKPRNSLILNDKHY